MKYIVVLINIIKKVSNFFEMWKYRKQLTILIWKRGRDKMITIMSMNVTKVYNHVLHPRLLHNLKKRKISNRISQWIKSFLKKRRFSIVFKKNKCDKKIKSNSSRKSSVLFVLYLFLNANLLNTCEQSTRKTTLTAFVNDVNVLAYSINTEEICESNHGKK